MKYREGHSKLSLILHCGKQGFLIFSLHLIFEIALIRTVYGFFIVSMTEPENSIL